MHNIEKSGFRRGEYVGYSPRGVHRIMRRPSGKGWYAARQEAGRDAGDDYIFGRTLAQISAKLNAAG